MSCLSWVPFEPRLLETHPRIGLNAQTKNTLYSAFRQPIPSRLQTAGEISPDCWQVFGLQDDVTSKCRNGLPLNLPRGISSGLLERLCPVTAAGQRWICTSFPLQKRRSQKKTLTSVCWTSMPMHRFQHQQHKLRTSSRRIGQRKNLLQFHGVMFRCSVGRTCQLQRKNLFARQPKQKVQQNRSLRPRVSQRDLPQKAAHRPQRSP